MPRGRSPSYPNFQLSEALERVERVFNADRQNPVDRETIAKHIGYSSLSGASDKAIATLYQYGLLERVAKGEMRVSALAIDILHPESSTSRARALMDAARHPALFGQLFERFDVIPSSSALQSYLKREGFLERAINPVSSAYLETCRYLEQNEAYENSIPSDEGTLESEPAQPTRVTETIMQNPEINAPRPVQTSSPADIFNLSGGGHVSMRLPSSLSRNEYEDLKDWLDLMSRRAERRIKEDGFNADQSDAD